LEGQGDVLLGARTDYIDRLAVAALRYQHGNHQIDVFVWPSSRGAAPRAPDAPIEGFRLATAQVPGFTAVMVSDLSARELDAFRDRWRAQAGTPDR
jgi:anti-sigma factor RsiW